MNHDRWSDPQEGEHAKFMRLAALSVCDQLSDDERRELGEHLRKCESCYEIEQQYRAIVARVLPALDEAAFPADAEGWSIEEAEASLMEKIRPPAELREVVRPESIDPRELWGKGMVSSSHRGWYIAAAVVLLIAALVGVYRFGYEQGHNQKEVFATNAEPTLTGGNGVVQHDAGASQDKAAITLLQRRIEQDSRALSQVRTQRQQLESELDHQRASENGLRQVETELADKLSSAEAKNQQLQMRIEGLVAESRRDANQRGANESEIASLRDQLLQQQRAIQQQQELLAHDRDIRELMGARDLYIAEVYDVADRGSTKKPYGRVFYTKGKSLIFYAYDLDQQPGLRNAKTFQAWGRRGTSWSQATSLGIFYEDNQANKRWVVRYDDPKKLSEIDAVFVTVEPDGGSTRPSGKPLLFAYIKIEPNHP